MQLARLWHNAQLQPSPARYLGQRLRIGWGTARVAVSMAMVCVRVCLFVCLFSSAKIIKAQYAFAELKEMSKKKKGD